VLFCLRPFPPTRASELVLSFLGIFTLAYVFARGLAEPEDSSTPGPLPASERAMVFRFLLWFFYRYRLPRRLNQLGDLTRVPADDLSTKAWALKREYGRKRERKSPPKKSGKNHETTWDEIGRG